MSRRHGLILISGLLIALVVAMLAGTMVIVAHADLSNTSHYRDRIRAREMALGGLNHLQYRWTYDPGWTQAISQNLEDESYTITFDASDPAHSVNNLMSLVPHTTPSVTGGIVYGGYADVVVVGRAGAALVKLHAITTRGLQSDKAVAASGRIVLQQDCLLDGVTSIVNPQPAGGGLFSDYVSNGIPAIDWTGVPGTFQMLGNSRLAVRPPDSGSAISASLSSFAPKVVETQIPTLKIPELQVDKWVASKAGVPVPPNMSTVSGANFLGSVNIHDDRRVDGDLTVNGDLVLSDGSLYVHGKLRINGGVIGVGSVFVDGDVEITGGATVVQTNQSSGAALFSSGNVTMAGLSADGYLDSLAAAYPTVAAAKATLQSQFYYMNLENSQIDPVNPATYQHFVNSHHYSSTLAGSAIGPGEQHTAYFIQSLPGPNGDYAQGNKNGVLPTMIEHIRNSLGPAYAGDLKAQKIVRAMDEILYQCGCRWPSASPPSVSPCAVTSPFGKRPKCSKKTSLMYASTSPCWCPSPLQGTGQRDGIGISLRNGVDPHRVPQA